MNPAPSTPEPSQGPALLAAGLGGILRTLQVLIAARFRLPKIAPHTAALCSYLNRLTQRFTRLMDRLAQGPLPPTRPRAPRPHTPRPRHRLPTGNLWLIRAIPNEAACFASQIAHLIAQPGMADLIAATPRAARMLRPVFRLLGLALPGPPPPAKPRIRAPRAKPEAKSKPPRWSYTPTFHLPIKKPA